MTDPKWLLVYATDEPDLRRGPGNVIRLNDVREFKTLDEVSDFLGTNPRVSPSECVLYPIGSPRRARLTFEEATDEAHQPSNDMAAADPVRDAAPDGVTNVFVDVDPSLAHALVVIPDRDLIFGGRFSNFRELSNRISLLAAPGEKLRVIYDAISSTLGSHLMTRPNLIPYPVKLRKL